MKDLQINLKEELVVVEEKKATTQALIENIGKEKIIVDEAVEIGRVDEEAAANLQACINLEVRKMKFGAIHPRVPTCDSFS